MDRKFTHLDAAESAFFERQLEKIKETTYDIKYPNLMGKVLIPVDTEAGPGATTVTYRQWDRRGRAKIVAQNAKDIPRVDVLGQEFPKPVREVAAAYGWTWKEVQSAAMSGTDLSGRRAMACREAIETELDEIAAVGSPDNGIADGFLNNSAVNVETASTTWADHITAGDPQLIIKDFSDAFARIDTATNGVEKPNLVVLPDAAFTLIATNPIGADFNRTILDFVKTQFGAVYPGFDVLPWYRCTTAGAGATTRMVTYKRDPSMVYQEITMEFLALPVQEHGLEYTVNCLASTAGTTVPYPLAMDYYDAI